MRRISEACLDAAIKANLGSHRSDEARAKTSVALKGRTFSVETRAKMSAANARRIVSPETRAKMSAANARRIASPETRAKMSARRGPMASHWQGGITPVNMAIRNSEGYGVWRTVVFVRDGYVCQKCHKRGNNLEAHHMDSFADFPEKRLDMDNGITFCVDCHDEFNRLYGCLHNRKWQTSEFLGTA